jgi:hypothetical protein
MNKSRLANIPGTKSATIQFKAVFKVWAMVMKNLMIRYEKMMIQSRMATSLSLVT